MIQSAVLPYAMLWLIFGALHSWLAGSTSKQLFEPLLGQYYRLAYNIFAAIHTLIILVVGAWLFKRVPGFDLPVFIDILRWLALLAGCVVLMVSLRQYDLGMFAGLKQIKTVPGEDSTSLENLQTAGIHRFVRHPLYTALFLLLWGIVDSPFGLVTAILGSLYLILGTYSEEKKLLELYGQSYQDYRQRVPAFFPWKALLSGR